MTDLQIPSVMQFSIDLQYGWWKYVNKLPIKSDYYDNYAKLN